MLMLNIMIFKKPIKKLQKKATNWWAKKLWNLVQIQGDGYYFNPIVDLQLGKSSDGKPHTYVNTRGINFRGGLGKQLTFLQPF
jgi:hypothetical protein